MGLRSKPTPHHRKQIMRAEILSTRPFNCRRTYRPRLDAGDNPTKGNVTELRPRRRTVRKSRCGRPKCSVSAGLPVCAELSSKAARADRLRPPSSNRLPLRRVAGHYSHIMVNAVAMARQLIQIVVNDPGLARYVRREAASLESLASSKPDLVVEELEMLRRRAVPDLPLQAPAADYARCVSVPVFWRHHLNPARRRTFRSGNLYRRYLESLDNRVDVISNDLRNDEPLVPAAHSWLVPISRISRLDGARTKRRLRIDDEPPYIVMVFPAERMDATGVEIRKPRGIDVIPSRLLQWSPGDVPDERIDQDIPTAALGSLEWRP